MILLQKLLLSCASKQATVPLLKLLKWLFFILTTKIDSINKAGKAGNILKGFKIYSYFMSFWSLLQIIKGLKVYKGIRYLIRVIAILNLIFSIFILTAFSEIESRVLISGVFGFLPYKSYFMTEYYIFKEYIRLQLVNVLGNIVGPSLQNIELRSY